MMKLDHIHHSGFAIEADGVTVIIDYYKNTPEEAPDRRIVRNCLLEKPGMLYVLSSYFHPDRFNREILSWEEEHSDIRCIFSKDILRHRRAAAEDATYINKGDICGDGHIRIEAFGSTNVGISFLIDLQGIRLFHAGDPNNWYWSEESTPQEVRKVKGDFFIEIKILQQKTPLVGVAMFPADNRIGKDYMRGAEQFVERVKTTIFAPMRFNEDYQDGDSFRTFTEGKGCRFLTISRRGESFDIIK